MRREARGAEWEECLSLHWNKTGSLFPWTIDLCCGEGSMCVLFHNDYLCPSPARAMRQWIYSMRTLPGSRVTQMGWMLLKIGDSHSHTSSHLQPPAIHPKYHWSVPGLWLQHLLIQVGRPWLWHWGCAHSSRFWSDGVPHDLDFLTGSRKVIKFQSAQHCLVLRRFEVFTSKIFMCLS